MQRLVHQQASRRHEVVIIHGIGKVQPAALEQPHCPPERASFLGIVQTRVQFQLQNLRAAQISQWDMTTTCNHLKTVLCQPNTTRFLVNIFSIVHVWIAVENIGEIYCRVLHGCGSGKLPWFPVGVGMNSSSSTVRISRVGFTSLRNTVVVGEASRVYCKCKHTTDAIEWLLERTE